MSREFDSGKDFTFKNRSKKKIIFVNLAENSSVVANDTPGFPICVENMGGGPSKFNGGGGT